MKNDKCNLNETFNGDKSFYDKESSDKSNMDKDKTIAQKRRVVVTGDSMNGMNGIHEKRMSKNHRVKVKNFPGSTSSTILENIDQIVKSKPDCLIVHTWTNDLANGTNLLNQAKKIGKSKKVSQNTKIVFSTMIIRKDHKNIDKKASQINSYSKNYSNQKNIDFIDNGNLKEERLGQKKLHLNKKGNSILANNFVKYLRSNF